MKRNGVEIPKSQEYFWSKEWQDRIKASEEDLTKGNYKTFKTKEELFAHLDSLKDEER
ncbi:hypothetical protein [Bacillus sp. 165]|uniref:hypothetical protein n=1 Tax=Bacillus sp. 165 TaxID=1529117 RepID=UPI001ADAF465|nr:hypothetical protein [Bacillus sp. 165]MBO9131430.1 hypothetical protein [Bacillus sp. 165]